MRLKQVKTVMNDIGLSIFNTWTRMPTLLSEIQMANNAREYPDKKTFYKIDTDNETILVSRYHDSDEEIDSSKDYDIDSVYYIQYIDAFICSSVAGPYGSYYTRMF